MELSAAALLSVVLSYAIVAGSLILKAPQIVKIVRAGSADGVSLTGHLVESLSYAIACSWGIARGLDFKDFGEAVFISFFLAVLVALIAFHQRKLATAVPTFLLIVCFGGALAAGQVPRWAHEMLLASQALLNMASRVPQIYMNYRSKGTGQLAAPTYVLASGGAAVRIFTTFMNVPWADGKLTLLGQFALAATLNTIILGQMFAYRGKAAKAAKKK
jgi:mannose-P-dolichol utilization defect protein 1